MLLLLIEIERERERWDKSPTSFVFLDVVEFSPIVQLPAPEVNEIKPGGIRSHHVDCEEMHSQALLDVGGRMLFVALVACSSEGDASCAEGGVCGV